MGLVKLVLSEDVPNLGHAGDLVDVKPGYARNYLLPQGKALFATDSRVMELEHHRRIIADKVARELKDLEAVRKRMRGITLEVSAQAGEGGKLFGSVTAMQVAEMLVEKGFEIDRRKVTLAEPIKSVGEHTIEVKLHRELPVQVKLVVHAEGGLVPADELEPDEEDAEEEDDETFEDLDDD